MSNFENFLGSLARGKREKIDDVNIDSAEALIVRVENILSNESDITLEEDGEIKEMIRTLEELQKDYASEKINTALAKLRHYRDIAKEHQEREELV